MKRIDAFVQSDKLRAVVDAIEIKKVEGVSIIQARGRGKGNRPMVEGQRGTGRHEAEYASLDEIIVVVDDSEVEVVEPAILNAANTGSKGDGKIFVTPVEKVIDIGTKRIGDSAL